MACINADYHTHTRYSHGFIKPHAKGTVMENADAAAALGLEFLGISDHGPGHIGYGLDMKKLPQIRTEIEAAKKAHPGLEIQLSVEANIINPSGLLDVSPEEQKLFDYIIAGYHYGIFGRAPFKAAMVHAGGYWYGATGRSSQRALEYNTDLVLAALEKNRLLILTHPGDKAAFDIQSIASACEKCGTWMEINAHHPCLTVEGIRISMEYDVKFVLSSDAHLPANVGRVESALARAIEAGLDLNRIVNYRAEG